MNENHLAVDSTIYYVHVPRIAYDLYGILTANKWTFSNNPVSEKQMGDLIDMVQGGGELTGM